MVNVEWCHKCDQPECRRAMMLCPHYIKEHPEEADELAKLLMATIGDPERTQVHQDARQALALVRQVQEQNRKREALNATLRPDPAPLFLPEFRTITLKVSTNWPVERIKGVLLADGKGNQSRAELVTEPYREF